MLEQVQVLEYLITDKWYVTCKSDWWPKEMLVLNRIYHVIIHFVVTKYSTSVWELGLAVLVLAGARTQVISIQQSLRSHLTFFEEYFFLSMFWPVELLYAV